MGEELANSDVRVVLNIKEGKGFEQILLPTLIVATLNGHSLETEIIEPNPNPEYDHDLVWEVDKNKLRKMRSGQVPLKLECFAVKSNDNKEKLGYLLLSLRSAQVFTKWSANNIKPNWHKLLGLKNEFKIHKPELLLGLSIHDLENTTGNAQLENYSEIDCHRNPAGDFGKYICGIQTISNEYDNVNKHIIDYNFIKDQPVNAICSHSVDTFLCQPNFDNYSKSVEAYHSYYLNILLEAIKAKSSKLAVPNMEIRFHHPKTGVTSTFHLKLSFSLGEKVKLQDIGCKFQFISAVDEIKQLLLSFPPKISIYKIEGNTKTCISQLKINAKELFCPNKPECQYDIPLYDMEHNNIGNLDVILNLEDHGPYYRIKRVVPNENLGPPIFDDTLAYKIVDELETWKERQMEIFKVELKRKEDRHLNLLSQEWQKHRENLETKLACSVEQCKMLANSLNNATEDLRTRRLKSLEKESRLIKANEDLQWRYEMKLRELKESSQIVQEELMAKINILEKRKTALEVQEEQLSIENERLQSLVAKQSEELENYQKGSLTQDQTANLLQELKTLEEKLQNAQENKSFFKEQWAKAVREIHRIKMEHQQAIQIQIKNSKEELQNLDLEEILCADTTALTNDQILLNEIQKEIDVIKPKAYFIEKDAYSQVFTPNSISSKISQNINKSTLKKSEEQNERLQALLEERDSLLKTGSYTIDDTIITKLNNEIRSLMMK
ncbi:centrosomal protein of 120 kDa isoform X2 [Apis mellifera]|uniref:Centrosomal protein of 120 kDa isoform X2 n=1 Tax=Apis mellifera TaxID=7460 RepID=A0A7M7GY65_APIME|nr:centrosomal protein of 120 kDa isoform X2 [Apis mellifera]|eukprot:XP_006569065.1 centrosomal protein of 120 kDa isoform X2 [Apis mellifera]